MLILHWHKIFFYARSLELQYLAYFNYLHYLAKVLNHLLGTVFSRKVKFEYCSKIIFNEL
jgi:hypothetical protein